MFPRSWGDLILAVTLAILVVAGVIAAGVYLLSGSALAAGITADVIAVVLAGLFVGFRLRVKKRLREYVRAG